MREILFRGKRIDNGEWVYGFYWEFYKEEKTLSVIRTELIAEANVIVKPETVGQYTGLKDRNGKKIFEGDIVELTDKNTHDKWTAVVVFGNPYGNSTWGWEIQCIGAKPHGINTGILLWVEIEESGAFCEVIGNIHDNPELLEVD